MIASTWKRAVLVLGLLVMFGSRATAVSPPEVLALLTTAHGFLHGPGGLTPDGQKKAEEGLRALAQQLSADPTRLNNQVRQRLVGLLQLLADNKPQEADDQLHQLYTFLSRPPALSHGAARATLSELHMFMHDPRPDALRRCEAGLIDYLDVLQLDASPLSVWAQEVVKTLVGLLEKGDAAAGDRYFHLVLKQLDPPPPGASIRAPAA